MKNQRNKAPRELLNEAKQISDQGDLGGAACALQRLTENYPNDMDVRLAYAAVLFRSKRYADAVPHFDSVFKVYWLGKNALCLNRKS